MFSVRDANEAEALISLACPLNMNGEYVAPELLQQQSLENLQAFHDRLQSLYSKFFNKGVSGDI